MNQSALLGATLKLRVARPRNPSGSIRRSCDACIKTPESDCFNHDASIQHCLKIIELDPNFHTSHLTLGLSYLKQGRKAEAVSAIEKAAELTNRSGAVLRALGYVYAAAGKRAAAIAVLKELEDKYARKGATGHDVAAGSPV